MLPWVCLRPVLKPRFVKIWRTAQPPWWLFRQSCMAANKSLRQELLSPGVSVPVLQLGDIGRLLSESARESIQSFGSKVRARKGVEKPSQGGT